MREQYDKEMAEVHASPELIRRTKAAMRQEEERIHKQKEAEKGHGIRAGIWMLAAVALVLSSGGLILSNRRRGLRYNRV